MPLTSIEMCAGAGGQALGLEQAGFSHIALVEVEKKYAETLKENRPEWNVFAKDLRLWAKEDAAGFAGMDIDLLAGGLPCPPFSVAGKQLGRDDERDLFPVAMRVVKLLKPKAVLIENVRGFLDPVFANYRKNLKRRFRSLGYVCDWKLLHANEFGVAQLRPRVAIIAYREDIATKVEWPNWEIKNGLTVGEELYALMAEAGWPGAKEWAQRANQIAPTVVGGSKKHGGPDLGPTRAKKAWAALSVDGMGIADVPPGSDFERPDPKLTVKMVAKLQGFPSNWEFSGGKTIQYRQVGNAFPPPVARALGLQVRAVLEAAARARQVEQRKAS